MSALPEFPRLAPTSAWPAFMPGPSVVIDGLNMAGGPPGSTGPLPGVATPAAVTSPSGSPGPVPGRSRTVRVPVDTYEELRGRLLELIQHDQFDTSDQTAVEAAARMVVGDYQRHARAGRSMLPLADLEAMVVRLVRSISGFGPLDKFLTDPPLSEEVMIRGCDVSYYSEGRIVFDDDPATEAELRSAVDRLLADAGAHVDESHPIVHAQVLDGAGRLTVMIPPVADRLDVTLRRYVIGRESLGDLVERGSLSWDAANFLAALMRARAGILIVGEPGAGKTTLLNAMLRAAPATLRVRCCEDTPELHVGHLSGGALRTRPAGPDGRHEISLSDLVQTALRTRPDLIVVGEVRGAEAYALTRAGNAGCGMMATIHANSARMGLQALVSTAIMAGENVPVGVVRSIFASVIDVVVFLAKAPIHNTAKGDAQLRQVLEVSCVPPLQASETDFSVEPIFCRDNLGSPMRWSNAPIPDDLRARLDRGLPPGVSVQAILEGHGGLL